MDGSGNFVVVWESLGQDDFGFFGTFGQRYSSVGSPSGPEFRVNSYTTSDQGGPSAAMDSSGKFVVVWQGTGSQDGNGSGVFGQRFCPPLASVTIAVNGSTSVCTTGTGGTATVTDSDGGGGTHQWAWRPMGGMSFTPIGAAMGTMYQIAATDFNGGVPGFYDLACLTNPQCGSPTFSNTILVTVFMDGTPPMVTAPGASTVTQTFCQ
jgi:hypothetical protein